MCDTMNNYVDITGKCCPQNRTMKGRSSFISGQIAVIFLLIFVISTFPYVVLSVYTGSLYFKTVAGRSPQYFGETSRDVPLILPDDVSIMNDSTILLPLWSKNMVTRIDIKFFAANGQPNATVHTMAGTSALGFSGDG